MAPPLIYYNIKKDNQKHPPAKAAGVFDYLEALILFKRSDNLDFPLEAVFFLITPF